jgi:hypothetical protein
VVRVLAVDWSGAVVGARKHIWLAEATSSGCLVRLEAGRDRHDLSQHLVTCLDPDVVVGFDFAFSFPLWFTESLGARTVLELWALVVAHGEDWLRQCEPPFWGRPGRPRPVAMGPALRRTDLAVPRTGGIAPKSIFQVGGAGAVGTASLRGMPLLQQLHVRGATIWPFSSGSSPLVVEIYPRLMTGPVPKSRAAAREALLASRYPSLAPEHRRLAVASEDGFDAAVSALVMIEHVADLLSLPPEPDPTLLLEGRIWHPNWRDDRL